MQIPMVDLKRQYSSIKSEIDAAISRVLESTRFIGGDEVSSLEAEIADYVGSRYAVAAASGTDALRLSLMALGIGPGDEVITTPFTFVATAEVIALCGAKPVFVDIDPRTYCIDPSKIEAAVTERTKAIIPVHLFGHPADWDRIEPIAEKYGLALVEDAAQSIGARYKGRKTCSLGDFGCLSFFPSKNLGAYGDGGMVTTDDPGHAKLMKMISLHGTDRKYYHKVLGLNSRLDAIQAAILRVKLRYLDGWNGRRREIAALYNEHLKGLDVVLPFCQDGAVHVYHQYSIQVEGRDSVQEHLKKKGVASAIYYPVPLHLQEVFSYLGYGPGDFPVSEEVSRRIISLPMFPELTEDEVRYVAESVAEAVGA